MPRGSEDEERDVKTSVYIPEAEYRKQKAIAGLDTRSGEYSDHVKKVLTNLGYALRFVLLYLTESFDAEDTWKLVTGHSQDQRRLDFSSWKDHDLTGLRKRLDLVNQDLEEELKKRGI